MGLCYSPAYLLSLWRFLGVKIWTTQAISMFFVTHFGSQIDQGPRNKNHVFSEGNKLGEPEIVCYDDTRQDFLNPYPFFKQKIDVCVCEFWFVSIFDQLCFLFFVTCISVLHFYAGSGDNPTYWPVTSKHWDCFISFCCGPALWTWRVVANWRPKSFFAGMALTSPGKDSDAASYRCFFPIY